MRASSILQMTVVSNPIFPEFTESMPLKCLADAAWILEIRKAKRKKLQNASGVLRVKFGEVAICGRRKFNAPCHSAASHL